MCLLVVLSRCHPDYPLVVAANRDEWLARPATPVTVLRPEAPRVIGGRDEVAGGTWVATNERGVVAGLTNRPPGPGGRLERRSRGELPLFLASHDDAESAVEAFGRTFRPADYNPSWLLVGDRASLHYVDMTGIPSGDRPAITALAPGLHVLENRELDADSAKGRHVRALLADIESRRGPALVEALAAVLRNHAIPAGAESAPPRADGFVRPLATEALCVHAGAYGTRSASIVLVPTDPARRPVVLVASGPPCEAAFVDVSGLWAGSPADSS